MTSAQSNYEIHDKELLAVINCLSEWDGMLRSVVKFMVITDHKNLEYFGKPQQLTERQVRWSQFLGRFPNMEIAYRPGKDNPRADALSRRNEDMPVDATDTRLSQRFLQVFKPAMAESEQDLEEEPLRAFRCQAAEERPILGLTLGSKEQNSLEKLWEEACQQDQVYQEAWKAVKDEARRFPTALDLKLSIAECKLDTQGNLIYRD